VYHFIGIGSAGQQSASAPMIRSVCLFFQAFEHYKVFAPITIKLNDFHYFFLIHGFTEQTICLNQFVGKKLQISRLD
jgi:hypothetical protein